MPIFILFLMLITSVLFGDDSIRLKNQQPNWRIQIIDEYLNGIPQKVELFAPKPKSQEWEKVKEKIFRPDGTLLRETDLAEGIREGATIAYYPSGKIQTIALYVNGKLEGALHTFDEQGVLRDKYDYHNDFLDGPYELFDSKGVVFEKGRYVKGKKEGEVSFFAETGEVIRKENYSQGVLDGELTEYYLNGNPSGVWHFYRGLLHGTQKHIASIKYSPQRKIIEEQDFRMGQPWGLHRSYNADGIVTMEKYVHAIPEYQYDNLPLVESLITESKSANPVVKPAQKIKKNGKHETFYENGSKRSLLEYKDGLLHGKKMLWDNDGDIIEEAQYIDGNLEGRYRHRDSNGAEKIVHYKNNQMHGRFEMTHPEHEFFGKLKALECYYDDGVLDGDLIEYNIAGTKISQTPYKQGVREGKALYFTDKGVLFRTVDFYKDQLHGTYEEFYPNGALKSEVVYKDGLREGPETHYFDHGGIKSVTHFKNGALNGSKKEWNSAGQLIFEGNFIEGKRDGVFRHYDENGNSMKNTTFVDDQKVVVEG